MAYINLRPGRLDEINSAGPYQLITAGDVSGDLASDCLDIRQFSKVSIQIVTTGTPTGNFYVQTSNILNPGTNDWKTFPFVDETNTLATVAPAGSGATYMINIHCLAQSYLRVIYTHTSGAGTGNVWITMKG